MVDDIEVLPAPPVRNRRHELAGLAILAANSLRHRIQGYRTPRPAPTRDAESSFRYSRSVVNNWMAHLSRYLHQRPPLEEWEALEIGPGSDLGTGLILLGEGLRSYRAIDVHALLRSSSRKLHRGICELVAAQTGASGEELLAELERFEAGEEGRLGYVHDPRLRLEQFGEGRFDLVLSHAAFEHLEDVPSTIAGLSRVVRRGAVLVSEIDLQTHTRWIREVDPLNIYRYRDPLYRTFSFSGIPNRARPDDYMEALVKQGWRDIRFFPRRVLPSEYMARVASTLAPRYRQDVDQMGWLSVVLCARYDGKVRR
jgi:SAM-dependent methyltransferase